MKKSKYEEDLGDEPLGKLESIELDEDVDVDAFPVELDDLDEE
jgi:hypothetical protein